MKSTELGVIVFSAYALLAFWLLMPKVEPKRQGEPIVQIYTDHGIVTKAKR